MKVHPLLHFSLLAAFTCTCQGAGYFSDFSSATVGDALVAAPATSGVDGWTQSEANNANISPKAWISNVGNTSTKGVAIGAFYDIYDTDPFYINRTLSTSLAGSTMSMTVGILDSTVDFAFRNNFSINLLTAGNSNLVTIDFSANSQIIPGTQSQRSWNVSVNGGTAFAAIWDNATYFLSMEFLVNGADVDYTLDITDTLDDTMSGTGTIASAATATIGNLRIGTTIGDGADLGDNIFAVTAIAVPEPSSTLLIGLGALGLLRRRRSA